MRTVATCGGNLLLLLVVIMAVAFVVLRRSPDAGPSPASVLACDPQGTPLRATPAPDAGPDPPGRTASERAVVASRIADSRIAACRVDESPAPPATAADPIPLARVGEQATASGLVLASGEVDFGDLDPDASIRVEIPWRRTGPGPLRVREVRTACGCLSATGLDGVIAEGARGALTLDVHVPRRSGPFDLAVRVVTDRPPGDVLRVDLLGFSGHEVSLEPRSLDLGTVPRGRAVERLVSVRLPAAAPDAAVSARLVGLTGTVDVHPPLSPGRTSAARERGAELLVRATPAGDGPIDGALEVVVGEAAPRRLPVRGRVEPP